MPEKSALVWTIKSFPGGKEYTLRCHFGLPSVEAEDEGKGKMPPIKVKFEIPFFTVSGVQVGGGEGRRAGGADGRRGARAGAGSEAMGGGQRGTAGRF